MCTAPSATETTAASLLAQARGPSIATHVRMSVTTLTLDKQPRLRLVSSPTALQRDLAAFNRLRLAPSIPSRDWRDALAEEARMRFVEVEFLERERAVVRNAAAAAPRDADAFVAWFEELKANGPGQGDPLFPFLATTASLEQMKWFLQQEVAGEAGFDDLVAMTQVKMPAQAKLELAHNYWDEMGQGNAGGMHGPMLGRLAQELALPEDDDAIVWESLALGNLLVGLATHRAYAYHSIGALGAIELTAPGRAEQVNAALKRLGVRGEARRYFALHATLDVKHSVAWNRDVLHPIVAERPEAASAIAEGALMRLRAGARCFERYRAHFGI